VECAIILPIYNDLHHVKTCIRAILRNTGQVNYKLCLINNTSDAQTTHYLKSLLKKYSHIQICHQAKKIPEWQLYINSIKLYKSPYFVFLHSRIIVPHNWLQRLLNAFSMQENIVSVTPLSNLFLPLATGTNFHTMDWFLQKNASHAYEKIDLTTISCHIFKRDILKNLLLQSQNSLQALNYYITNHHRQSILVQNVYVQWQTNEKIEQQNLPIAAELTMPQRWFPMPVIWQTYREMLKNWQQRQILQVIKAAFKGLLQLPSAYCDFAKPSLTAKLTYPQRLRVTYILPKLVIAGGVLSVIQLVNRLILQGIEARIVTLFEDPILQNYWQILTRPILFKKPAELIKHCPTSDIIVATHWTTAHWVNKIKKSGKATHSVYFLQDYESWFYPENNQRQRQKVLDTYALIPNKIVKSAWLQDLLQQDGYDTTKIWLGMNLDVFYPRQVKKETVPVILAMARPGTSRRGFEPTMQSLTLVKQKLPHVKIILFGDNHLVNYDIPFDYQDEGVIFDQEKLAQLYSLADVFIDGSNYQGFGRLALESMACGTACVVTNVGGVTEYAKDKENCLMVSPKQSNDFAAAILNILHDQELNMHLIQGGLKTVKAYDIEREAVETFDYFQALK